MTVTAYCNCGSCCSWEYGLAITPTRYVALRWKPPFIAGIKRRSGSGAVQRTKAGKPKAFLVDRYWTGTSLKGRVYEGTTAQGTPPRQARDGPFSPRSLRRPLRLAARAALAPWFFLGRHGTIAADLNYYPFGTRMRVAGYGWGTVEDCGSAIQGPDRLDLFFNRHRDALQWGRRHAVAVDVVPPGREWIDRFRPPLVGGPPWRAAKAAFKAADRVAIALFG